MGSRRVVLTGLGTINPMGYNVGEFWSNLIACKSGIRRVQRFDVSAYSSQIGGEVLNWETVPEDMLDFREAKRMDRFCQFAVTAAIEAFRDSGLDFARENLERCGVIFGSGIGGLQELEDQHKRMLDKGPGRISPFTVPKLMANAAAGSISIVWGLQGPNMAVVTACASGANAIGEAKRCIERDECDLIITGGSEAALTRIGLAAFCALKGLSTRNDDPEHASRPWDKDRDGFLLSEGAGAMVVEDLEHAHAAPHPLAAQEDVGPDVEVLGEGEVLVDGLDARGEGVHGRLYARDMALHEDLPLVGPVDAGDDLDEGRLARPIVPEDGEGLPRAQADAHIVHRGQAAKTLRDAPGLE